MIRLIAMDMDGTLLDPRWPKRIPPENVAVLREAAKAGVHLAICSGRTGEDCSFYASDAGLDVHILALNGGWCLDRPHGALVSRSYLPKEAVSALAGLLAEEKLLTGWFGDEDLVVNYDPEPGENLGLSWGDHLTRPGSLSRVTYRMDGFAEMSARGVCKLVIINPAEDDALVRLRRTIETTVPGVDVTSSWYNNLEIMPRGVDKGAAVQALAARLGLPMDAVMTIGDNDNDIAMLALPCCSVAMAKSTDGAIRAARHHLAETADCGVAAAVRRFVLGRVTTEC